MGLMNKEIYVITNAPINDLFEFKKYCSEYIDKCFSSNKVLLKDGTTLIFHRNDNMTGIHSYYLYHEIFESFLKRANNDLKDQLDMKNDIINKVSKRLKLLGKYDDGACTRGFKMMSADLNQLIKWLDEGEYNE